jgi:hypothetical protein
MFVVRFVRKDGLPNEEYYYHFAQDAIRHFLLFENDDSNLYDEVCLIMKSYGTVLW